MGSPKRRKPNISKTKKLIGEFNKISLKEGLKKDIKLMNIGVIGLGIVGSAYKDGFTLWGHTVTGYDKKGKNNFRKILNCDLVFICVPTPSKKDGSCDISIIASVLSKLSKSNCLVKQLFVQL